MTHAVSPTLAERLGYRPEDRLLIVNCDDLGVSQAANAATLRALRDGIASSASLMVPCPWAQQAAQMTAGLPVGIHLTLTAEYPSYRWRGLTDGASLHDGDGCLPATSAAALARLDPADAMAECQAQIETALGWGVDVTHLDAHMNVMQARSDLFAVYLALATRFRLPVRMFAADETERQGFRARERAAAAGVLFPDHMLYPWPRPSCGVLAEQAARLPRGVTEIFAHPVDDGAELRGYDPWQPALRADDAAGLVDPALATRLDEERIQRISFRPLRDLQRSGGA